jgi:hypothetical protein
VLLAASDPNIVVRRYVGKQDQAFADFQVDAAQMARAGWFPTVQHYLPGSWPAGAIFIAFPADSVRLRDPRSRLSAARC